ncbi:MAG: RNA chaperone Hfq [Gammaproteobacteria bacterium]
MPSENTAQPGESCQFAMLEELCQQQTPVSIYLVNGIRLNGLIVDMDRFSILLRDATDQLIYKQAISTVVPNPGGRRDAPRPPRGPRPGGHDDSGAPRQPRRPY